MASGHAYLVMEFLEGMPLSHRIRRRGPIPEGEAALLLRGVCAALAAAHEKAVVHRDLKPDNIFVVPDPESAFGERTKILDFGIAKLTDIGLAPGGGTRTGAVMGTPAYMSPEQCRGTGDVDYRADLYSIGCMFYELVTGRPPFVQAGAGELIAAHLFVAPESPARFVAGLSAETEALILALLAKRPEDRVQSAKELAHRLQVIAQRHGWIAPADAGRSMRDVAGASPYSGEVRAPTPAFTPAPRTSPPGTPPPVFAAQRLTPAMAAGPMPAMPAMPTPAPKPTTLSGAARQVPAKRRSSTSIGFALAGVLLIGAGVFAIVARSRSGTATADSPPAAVQPAAQVAAPTAPPAQPPPVTAPAAQPAALPPAVQAPAAQPAALPPAVQAPAAQPAALPPAVQAPAAEPSAQPVTPPVAPPPAAPPPSAQEPPATSPATQSPAPGHDGRTPSITRPASGKPTPKPRRTPRPRDPASQSKDMLEQDI